MRYTLGIIFILTGLIALPFIWPQILVLYLIALGAVLFFD